MIFPGKEAQSQQKEVAAHKSSTPATCMGTAAAMGAAAAADVLAASKAMQSAPAAAAARHLVGAPETCSISNINTCMAPAAILRIATRAQVLILTPRQQPCAHSHQ